jgi:hypothetical protein
LLGERNARFGWTGVRIRRTTRFTRPKVFRRGSGKADILTVYTTHLKEGWIRRNGIPRSDRSTVTEHFIRHGDGMTLMTINQRSRLPDRTHGSFARVRVFSRRQIGPYPCEPVEEVVRPKGVIPHHLPGTNPFLKEFADAHKVPYEGARGGAETMYPEYQQKLKK